MFRAPGCRREGTPPRGPGTRTRPWSRWEPGSQKTARLQIHVPHQPAVPVNGRDRLLSPAVGHHAFVTGNANEPQSGRGADQLSDAQSLVRGCGSLCARPAFRRRSAPRGRRPLRRRRPGPPPSTPAAESTKQRISRPGSSSSQRAEACQAEPVDDLIGDEDVPVSPGECRSGLVHGGDGYADGAGSHLPGDDRCATSLSSRAARGPRPVPGTRTPSPGCCFRGPHC